VSSIWKGLLLAACNVFVVALLVVAGDSSEFRTGRDKMIGLYAIVIVGLPPALVVGAVAGSIAERLAVLRRLALIGITAGAVVVLGLLSFPKWIPYAIGPTIAGALVLEACSRCNLAAYVPRTIPVSPVRIGALLGAANVCLAAVVLGLYVKANPMAVHLGLGGEVAFQVTAVVACVGMLPGIAFGALAGLVAGRLGERGSLVRITALVGIALLGMLMLAGFTEQTQLVAPATLPTAAAALVLERLTRRAPPLPMARVLA
jgi:uncharacterized membrane protein YeaQ/YmgE (transglycosylase-associated protein family)